MRQSILGTLAAGVAASGLAAGAWAAASIVPDTVAVAMSVGESLAGRKAITRDAGSLRLSYPFAIVRYLGNPIESSIGPVLSYVPNAMLTTTLIGAGRAAADGRAELANLMSGETLGGVSNVRLEFSSTVAGNVLGLSVICRGTWGCDGVVSGESRNFGIIVEGLVPANDRVNVLSRSFGIPETYAAAGSSITRVPEQGTLTLMLAGLGVIGLISRRRLNR